MPKRRWSGFTITYLAAVVAAASLPWMWQGGSQDELAKDLVVLLAHTPNLRESETEIKGRAQAAWRLLMQRGQALRCFERSVNNMTLAGIRERVRIEGLLSGDLLWQGPTGFCVFCCENHRDPKATETVLKLQGDGTKTGLRASYIVPIRAPLEEEVVPRTRYFGDPPAKSRASSFGNCVRQNCTYQKFCRCWSRTWQVR